MSGVAILTEEKSRIRFLNKHTTAKDEFKLHSHNCYEIIYFLSGNGTINIDGTSYPITANTCCIIPPNTKHTELLTTYGEIVFIGFDLNDLEIEKSILKVSDKSILTLFERIIEEYSSQKFGFKQMSEALLDLLIVTYIREMGTEGEKCKDMVYIKTYIEQYYNQKINFSELAVLSGYSYDYFRTVFKQKFGASPQKYLINIRLNHAKHLLESTSLSCTEIAYNCGFSNSAQMTTMLKNKFGKTPKELKITD